MYLTCCLRLIHKHEKMHKHLLCNVVNIETLCTNVRMKEGSGQGWLVETLYFIAFLDKLKQVRTLRVLCTSTLSVVSAITLCVRSGCHSRHRPCARVSTPSLSELPFHGGFYLVSTPITAIRHRCSSFCTWPTYLPPSPESFSRCRLCWTTPPSPHSLDEE